MQKVPRIVYKLLSTMEIVSLVFLFVLLALEICCTFGATNGIAFFLKKINIPLNEEKLPLMMGITAIFCGAIEIFKCLIFKKF